MTARQRRPRRESGRADKVKLHRRTMVLDGREYTVVSLRPGTDFRFATNRFHGTWHVLSDWRGARVLGRLFWGLAYQRTPGTLVVLDPAHLDTNPFDGAPSDPVVLVPSDLTVFTRKAATALRRRLSFAEPSQGTVRWHTFGLDAAVAELVGWRERGFAEYRPRPTGWMRVDHLGGMVTVFGAPDQLRSCAVGVARLGAQSGYHMDYDYLDDSGDGEVQIFRQYRAMVATARQARADVVGADYREPLTPETELAIWSRAEMLRRARLPALGNQC